MKNLLISLALIMSFLVLIAFTADLPKTDLHVHLTANYANTTSLRYEKAAALSSKMGIIFGVAEEISTSDKRINDRSLSECIKQVRKYPLYLGLQVNQPGWSKFYLWFGSVN